MSARRVSSCCRTTAILSKSPMFMSTLALAIDTRSLRRNSLGTISGIVYAQINGVSFPATNWNDLIVAVLVGWLDTISRLARRASWTERFHFLDGPFAIDLTLTQDGILQVRSIERRLAGDVATGTS